LIAGDGQLSAFLFWQKLLSVALDILEPDLDRPLQGEGEWIALAVK